MKALKVTFLQCRGGDVMEFTGGVAYVVRHLSVRWGGGVHLCGDGLYLAVQLQREEAFIITIVVFLTITSTTTTILIVIIISIIS